MNRASTCITINHEKIIQKKPIWKFQFFFKPLDAANWIYIVILSDFSSLFDKANHLVSQIFEKSTGWKCWENTKGMVNMDKTLGHMSSQENFEHIVYEPFELANYSLVILFPDVLNVVIPTL